MAFTTRAGLDFRPRTLARVPFSAPDGLLNPLTVGLFNEFWFRKAPLHQQGKLHTIGGFFHPLDGVAAWNRLYGRRGFLQYQFVVPDECGEAVRRVIERISAVRLASFLAVLKRFGPGDPGPLSFPMPGWTLALDLPVGYHQLDRILDSLDDEIIAAGGRVYLAKDSRVSPAAFRSMYPRAPNGSRCETGWTPTASSVPTSVGGSACAPTGPPRSEPSRPPPGSDLDRPHQTPAPRPRPPPLASSERTPPP